MIQGVSKNGANSEGTWRAPILAICCSGESNGINGVAELDDLTLKQVNLL
jgi:hypothetical protein